MLIFHSIFALIKIYLMMMIALLKKYCMQTASSNVRPIQI